MSRFRKEDTDLLELHDSGTFLIKPWDIAE
jgi:hypothetical protein